MVNNFHDNINEDISTENCYKCKRFMFCCTSFEVRSHTPC